MAGRGTACRNENEGSFSDWCEDLPLKRLPEWGHRGRSEGTQAKVPTTATEVFLLP